MRTDQASEVVRRCLSVGSTALEHEGRWFSSQFPSFVRSARPSSHRDAQRPAACHARAAPPWRRRPEWFPASQRSPASALLSSQACPLVGEALSAGRAGSLATWCARSRAAHHLRAVRGSAELPRGTFSVQGAPHGRRGLGGPLVPSHERPWSSGRHSASGASPGGGAGGRASRALPRASSLVRSTTVCLPDATQSHPAGAAEPDVPWEAVPGVSGADRVVGGPMEDRGLAGAEVTTLPPEASAFPKPLIRTASHPQPPWTQLPSPPRESRVRIAQ